jgi:hypothetical protein
VDGMDKPPACPPRPRGEQNQKKPTFDVLQKPDKLIRYRQEKAQVLFPELAPVFPSTSAGQSLSFG